MPTDLRVITPPDFLRADSQGEIDLQTSRDLLRSIFKTCAENGIVHILIDVRRRVGQPTFKAIATLASDLGDLGMSPEFRLAILHRPRGIYAEFMAEVSKKLGWRVGAFDNFEEAFDWLSAESPWKPPRITDGNPPPPPDSDPA